jgi:hypothetical protein
VLVVVRAGGAGKIVNLVNLDPKRERDVMSDELERRVVKEMGNVLLGASEQVVNADNVMAKFNQLITQMRSYEPGPTGNKDALFQVFHASSMYRVSTGLQQEKLYCM